ncbi:AraC family transcriptional regulator [uncultured Croceitalea sp.]|uniref:AraC family transcriptional regulator n=1 Tax=uncultured Croceitalea sp. TaxID=1798908 RepID=UPI0033067FFB
MQIYPFKIPKKPTENIVLQIDRSRVFYDKLHQHEEIQISHIVSGKGKLLVGNTVNHYEAGDTIAIGSNLPHLFQSQKSETESHMISLFFLKDAFGDTFFELPEMKELLPFFDAAQFGFSIRYESYNLFRYFKNLNDSNKLSLFIQFLELLKMINGLKKTMLNDLIYAKELTKDHGSRLQLVYDFVINNFQEEITLDKVADLVHLSQNAFCRFFKQRSNKSFFTFLTEIRIAHACQLLQEYDELPISEIAVQCGFATTSNFNKHFKTIKGCSPTKFKKQLF